MMSGTHSKYDKRHMAVGRELLLYICDGVRPKKGSPSMEECARQTGYSKGGLLELPAKQTAPGASERIPYVFEEKVIPVDAFIQ